MMGKRMGIRHLIFDLDGTLILLPVKWSDVRRKLSEVLQRRVRSIVKLYSEIWMDKELFKVVSAIVEEHELKALTEVKVLDDSPKVLKELSSNYRLSLVTLQSDRVASAILDDLGVRSLFLAKVTRDDIPLREEQIRIVLDRTGFRAEETVVIGDLMNDVRAALRVGCWAIHICRRWTRRLREVDDRVRRVKSLKEVNDVLRSWQTFG